MPDKKTELLEVTVQVRVCPEEFKPYPVIANLLPLQRAIRMLEEKMVEDVQWLDGVDELVGVRTRHITTTELVKNASVVLNVPMEDVDIPASLVAMVPVGDHVESITIYTRCPTCDSSHPHLHPAMQFEGEVQPCKDPFHLTITSQNQQKSIDQIQNLINTSTAVNREPQD